ncbi:MAG: DUF3048 domain-containing protein [Oscillospiraceae bacterium]|nr:DUF3048 domain-containing protein [Oscillospiraceae bacterium]
MEKIKSDKSGVFTIKKILTVLLALSLLAFSGCKKAEEVKDTILDNPPRQTQTETKDNTPDYNPLTGEKTDDKTAIYSRPVAVMINNAKIAMPQSGLTDADIIYEMVTEAGVTRLMAVYNDISDIKGRVGPVRSARDQFIEFVLPLNAVYVHIGTSTTAKRMLNFYKYRDIDGIYLGFLSFSFDSELSKIKSSEHCWYTDADLIKAGIEANNIGTVSAGFYPAFNFVDANGEKYVIDGDKTVYNIAYSYSNYRDVSFSYNPETDKYLKFAFGTPHSDADTGEQLAFDNVIVLMCEVGVEEENGILPEFYLDEGDGFYFTGGKMQKIKWSKKEPEDPLVLRDENDELLSINTGKTYVGVLSTDRADTVSLTDIDGNLIENKY